MQTGAGNATKDSLMNCCWICFEKGVVLGEGCTPYKMSAVLNSV